MTTRNRLRLLLPVLVAALFGCDGDNLFRTLPPGSSGGSGGTGGNGTAGSPQVQIQEPTAGRRVAIQDSLLVRVRLRDDAGIKRLEIAGFALRGDPSLGTEERVDRFETKVVEFASTAAVSDTVIARYLLATPDSLSDDRVLVVATATDAQGNVAADTALISIGGPRVQIVSPAPGASVRAGTSLSVEVSAADAAGRIRQVRVRSSGGFTADTAITIDPATAEVARTVVFPIPSSATGSATLTASVLTIANDSAASSPVTVQLVPPVQDVQAPTVSFDVSAPVRAERGDSVTVQVTATDSTEVGIVGITVLPIHRLATRTDTLTTLRLTSAGGARTFRFSLDQLGMPEPRDTSTLRLEVTAFATDTAGNCATATVAGTALSESCQPVGSHTFGPRSGARWEILLVRGTTVPLSVSTDRIADLASDGRSVFLSNISQNRVDVLPVGGLQISASVSVGARPWGLAFDRDNGLLYVANSGGTNISVVSPVSLREVERIRTPNIKLFDVAFKAAMFENPAAETDPSAPDSISGNFPTSVRAHDYSDRPQFIGVTQNDNLIYSTLPTAAAADGTVRIYRTAQARLEIVTQYAERRPAGKLVIINADSAFVVSSEPNALIQVCPRRRSADPATDSTLAASADVCFTGEIGTVEAAIRNQGYDTEFQYNRDITEIGLTDTTFVAVSGDHSTVAFGEGAREHARVMVLVDSAGAGPTDPLFKHGEIQDLVGNTAERVIGLALNEDGSLGVARGAEAYFFSRDLRLQGMVSTGAQSGGVDMHPENRADEPTVRRSFVSGIQENGLAYIDVVDSFHFRQIARIFMRDPVTGPVRAVQAEGAMLIYAVTERGVVVVEVLTDDL